MRAPHAPYKTAIAHSPTLTLLPYPVGRTAPMAAALLVRVDLLLPLGKGRLKVQARPPEDSAHLFAGLGVVATLLFEEVAKMDGWVWL